MSHLLWRYYWENDVDRFRRLLAPAGPSGLALSKSPAIGSSAIHLGAGPASGAATPPRASTKPRKTLTHPPPPGRPKDGNVNIGKSDVNSRDHVGLTILLRAASSVNPNAIDFVQALLDHPALDLYAQDPESGWNALHRSLYTGNISIARLLLAKERAHLMSHTAGSVSKVGRLIKTKDHEGNSPFDLYNSSIAARSLRQKEDGVASDDGSDNDETIGDMSPTLSRMSPMSKPLARGDEIFVFGSNKNLSLGVGDGDDRQYPERIILQRPDHLLHRFYSQHLYSRGIDVTKSDPPLDEIPTLVRNEPLIIQDIVMSKFHSAILTSDPVSNLYVSGVGRGGRLGLGDENTHFKFVPVQGPLAHRRVRQVALGQNHSMAIADHGELWTWGLNSDSQLGYVLAPPLRADEDPMSLIPRQVYGPLKKELVLGIAASAVHSVAHTGSSLYCWGRNLGQLALMDADSRSLDVQQTPRKVAASLLQAPIEMVSAIDRATTCLLSNHTVWVFTNYGYNLVKFPLPDAFSNYNLVTSSLSTRYDMGRRDIRQITSGGDTIAALTARGDLFTMQLRGDSSVPFGSTTNPVKIKGALTQPQCIWQSRKDGVASVSVGEHGSVIICTESGAVWKRVKRAQSKISGPIDAWEVRRKDFKFQRIPYITDCVAISSSTFGAFAAIRKDCKVMAEEIALPNLTLCQDIASLLCLESTFMPSASVAADGSPEATWAKAIARENPGSLVHRILSSADIESDLLKWLHFNASQFDVDMEVRTSSAPDIRIPVHGWVMAGRSPFLREALSGFRRGHLESSLEYSETFLLEDSGEKTVLTLRQVDIYTVLNLVLYAYQDAVVPVWECTREAPLMAYRFRQVRSELTRIAYKLDLPKLERAVRLQTMLQPSQSRDFQNAIHDPMFFEDGDVVLELDGGQVAAHSQLLCKRCPFFEGMFHGRSQGQWLASRRDQMDKMRIDLRHIRAEIFAYVLSFLYGDVGIEVFVELAMPTLDEFCEVVIEVLSVANELMIDGLAQICQLLIGQFVTTRNIANLLNEISPCVVSEFKDRGLEYICLQLENMLENHLLEGLEDDLLRELDSKVRENQLACLPVARSGRAELLLHDKYPTLILDIEEERRIRVREIAFRHFQREEERKHFPTSRLRPGGLRPALSSKGSRGEMVFEFEEEEQEEQEVEEAGSAEGQSRTSSRRSPQVGSTDGFPVPGAQTDLDVSRLPEASKTGTGTATATANSRGEASQSPGRSSLTQSSASFFQSPKTPTPRVENLPVAFPGKNKTTSPWASPTLPIAKLDMKDILSEASSKSSLTAALAAQATKDAAARPQAKVSQKERKKQVQMQMQMQLEAQAQAQAQAQAASREDHSKSKAAPWDAVSALKDWPVWKTGPTPKTSLKEAMSAEESDRAGKVLPARPKPLVAAESSSHATHRRTASPDTRFPGQGRSHTSPALAPAPAPSPAHAPATASSSRQQQQQQQQQQQANAVLVPHSKQYLQPASKAETWVGASMADIIGQQRRERELVKEAVAKRSLQEIQQEQAFQEWWDQESRRTQEEEARRTERSAGKDARGARRSRASRDKKRSSEGTRKPSVEDGGRGAKGKSKSAI